MTVPDNVVFLPTAAEEYLRLREAHPKAHAAISSALIALGRDGPPKDTCYVPFQEPPFPNTLAYRFEVFGFAIVFECDQRVILQTPLGMKIVRALRFAGADPIYTIWAIIPPSA
ncbi:MAG: hypothetical protein HY922_06095 [Elusimicrobia bacterium]|nr:hypothetical protein [Elusimicrobiota bacterium]